jgi:hypothetical protein
MICVQAYALWWLRGMSVIASRREREGGCMMGLNTVSPSFSPQCSATKVLA